MVRLMPLKFNSFKGVSSSTIIMVYCGIPSMLRVHRKIADVSKHAPFLLLLIKRDAFFAFTFVLSLVFQPYESQSVNRKLVYHRQDVEKPFMYV